MDGTLDEVRDLLNQVVQREKRHSQEGEDARFRELQMEALPSDAAGALTAHVEPDAEAVVQHPTAPRTLSVTLVEVDSLRWLSASLSVFMHGDDERLAAYVDIVVRRGGGRVLAPDRRGTRRGRRWGLPAGHTSLGAPSGEVALPPSPAVGVCTYGKVAGSTRTRTVTEYCI